MYTPISQPSVRTQTEKSDFKDGFQKRLIDFSLEVIALCRTVKEDRLLWPIADQLLRAATSIGANIMEAKGSGSRRDYVRFFEIALKSANETRYWLLITVSSCPSLKDKTNALLKEAEEISKIIATSIMTMKARA